MKKVLSIVFFLMTTLCTFGQVFTDDLHVTSGGGRTTDYTQKEVELKRVGGSRYKVTFKKLAPMAYKTFGDFVIDNVMSKVDADGVTTFTTSTAEGKWVNVTSTAAIGGVTEGSKSTLTSFTATLSADKSKFVAYDNGFGRERGVRQANRHCHQQPNHCRRQHLRRDIQPRWSTHTAPPAWHQHRAHS